MKTLCRDCAFAKYDENDEEQVGCELDRLAKFAARGVVINTEEDKSKSVEAPCNAYRNAAWAQRFTEWGKFEIGKWVDAVKKEIKPTFDVFILHDKDDSFQTLKDTIQSFVDKEHVKKIIVVVYGKNVDIFSLLSIFPKNLLHVIKPVNYYETSLYLDGMREAHQRLSNRYFVVAKTGFMADSRFFKNFERFLNEELYCPFMFHSDDILECPVVFHTEFYKFYHHRDEDVIGLVVSHDNEKKFEDGAIIYNGYKTISERYSSES